MEKNLKSKLIPISFAVLVSIFISIFVLNNAILPLNNIDHLFADFTPQTFTNKEKTPPCIAMAGFFKWSEWRDLNPFINC